MPGPPRKRAPEQEVLMAEPFLSEIRIMSFGFAPKGWALCNGQLLPINQKNQALFALLGTDASAASRITSSVDTTGGSGQPRSSRRCPDALAPYPLAAREPSTAPVLAMPARIGPSSYTL